MNISSALSLHIKGILILMMVVHHVLGFPYQMSFFAEGMIPVFPASLEQFAGTLGKVCVPIYLMLSGYGFSARGRTDFRYYLDKTSRTFGVFWFYFAIFVPIGLIWFRDVRFFYAEGYRYRADALQILGDAFAVTNRFNDTWWFLRSYLVLTLAGGILVRVAHRSPPLLAAGSAALFALSMRLFPDPSHAPQDALLGVLFWQFPFVLGILLERHAAGRVSPFRTPGDLGAAFVVSLVALSGALLHLRMTWQIWASLPVLLAMAAVLPRLRRLQGVLAFLGRHNQPIWLVHAFFCYYYWQPQMLLVRHSLLVVAFVFLASLATSIACEPLRNGIGRFLAARITWLSSPRGAARSVNS